MALQGSGQISIGDIATEFGDAAPNNLSEFYGAGGAPGSGELRISDFYGRSNTLLTRSITVGYVCPYSCVWGYSLSTNPVTGSINNSSINLWGSNTITSISYAEGTSRIEFAINTVRSNSGFTALKIGNNTFNRASALYSESGASTWSWSSSNIFTGLIGNVVQVEWL